MLRRSKSCFSTFVCSLIFSLVGLAAPAQDGEALAKTWCSSCHMFPEPGLLDKKTWIGAVLPEMGARLGFQSFRDGDVRPSTDTPDGVYPAGPIVDADDWEKIISWYENQAPDTLILPDVAPRRASSLFDIELPEEPEGDLPVAIAIMIDEIDEWLLVSDSGELDIEVYSQDLDPLMGLRAVGVISRLKKMQSGYLATVMGETIGQTEELRGQLVEIELSPSPIVRRLVRRLHRPVDFVAGDFNRDGQGDYVIAEFGTHTGKVSLHLGQPDGTLREVVLLDQPGATALHVAGRDLWVLMAQGDERVVRLKDFAGGGPTVSETLLRFPPSQGSSSMRVIDFDADGILDILYAAGDNADISPIFKPYHGVYLFKGMADGTFQQTLFFHLDGATSAVAEDFDLDGDLDIAAIAYYSNIDRGLDEAGFVYLENTGDGFDAKRVGGLGELGRYVAISTGDIDGDGDKDIALANLAYGPPGPLEIPAKLRGKWSNGTSFVLLRNLRH